MSVLHALLTGFRRAVTAASGGLHALTLQWLMAPLFMKVAVKVPAALLKKP